MSKALSNLRWHDGNLVDVVFGIDKKGTSSLQITALFYMNELASSRDAYQIKCEGVSRFNSTLNANELKDNMFAGNIANGYLKDDTLWVYFSDGLIEVQAKMFRLAKC
jgi:hypothetical protein